MKGQGSIEYMIILAAVLVVFATVTHSQMTDPAKDAATNTEKLSKARTACDTIASAINTVYNPYTEGSKTTEFVEFPQIENLEITSDNVQISILYDEEKIWVGSSIKYGFENSLSDTPNGSYTLIVEWNTSESESIRHIKENDEIHINIRPGGG